jgi:hypothetical protein
MHEVSPEAISVHGSSAKQAIAGVSPSESSEVTSIVVWPSIATFALGRAIGSILAIRWPNLYLFRLGILLAPLCIPVALALYFYRLMPSFFGLPLYGTYYRLTNRRLMELRNEITSKDGQLVRFVFGAEIKSVQLDRFNAIDIVQRPGQPWYNAGDLIFRDGATETFRLTGVSRPEAFRQACLKAHMAYVGVKQALSREAARSAS